MPSMKRIKERGNRKKYIRWTLPVRTELDPLRVCISTPVSLLALSAAKIGIPNLMPSRYQILCTACIFKHTTPNQESKGTVSPDLRRQQFFINRDYFKFVGFSLLLLKQTEHL